MKILMFLPSINVGLTYVHEGNLRLIDDLGCDLVGIVTSVKEEAGKKYRGAPVYYMKEARHLGADFLVFPKIFGFIGFNIFELLEKLINEYRFPKEKIVYDDYLLKKYMTTKYETSTDPDIQASLKYWQNHELDPFNQYMEGVIDTYDEVFIDDKLQMPYIFFETIAGKRLKMYYPRNHPNFEFKDGKPYVKNILQEQIPASPHLYTTETHKIEDGDVIIDAGVCEGNFSLRYVDIASKFYLFENNANWIEPLYHTFTAAKIDGNIFPKGVGSETNDNCVRIDEVVDYTRGV